MSAVPSRKLAIVCCMDARLDPIALFGLEAGDAHVIRNAGGVITDDVIRSLAMSQHLLDTEEIAVVQHTDCGAMKITDDEFARRLEADAGERPPWSPATFRDLEASVRSGIKALRRSPFIPRTDAVRGYVFEIESGSLREVE